MAVVRARRAPFVASRGAMGRNRARRAAPVAEHPRRRYKSDEGHSGGDAALPAAYVRALSCARRARRARRATATTATASVVVAGTATSSVLEPPVAGEHCDLYDVAARVNFELCMAEHPDCYLSAVSYAQYLRWRSDTFAEAETTAASDQRLEARVPSVTGLSVLLRALRTTAKRGALNEAAVLHQALGLWYLREGHEKAAIVCLRRAAAADPEWCAPVLRWNLVTKDA